MESIVQLKITLKNSEPPIYRRLLVETERTFFDLHHIIQVAMGWENRHMFVFDIHKHRLGWLDEDWNEIGDERKIVDAAEVTLDNVLTGNPESFEYSYDFGDDWVHVIEVEEFLPKAKGEQYPRCLMGEGDCPPEDIGGIGDYYNWLEKQANKAAYKSDEDRGWYKTVAFDIENVNRSLAKIEQYIIDWNLEEEG